ncbi:hypothetical protein L1283_001798 [Sphingobacterium sp. HSC-15S19]
MKKREIQLPPLPQTKALSQESDSAFFCFRRESSTKNSTNFKIRSKAVRYCNKFNIFFPFGMVFQLAGK